MKRVSRLSEFAALILHELAVARARGAGTGFRGVVSSPLAPKELGTLLAVVLGGTLLALGLSRRSAGRCCAG